MNRKILETDINETKTLDKQTLLYIVTCMCDYRRGFDW
jgi:hypothetical protein